MKIQHQDSDLIVFESALFRTTTSILIGTDYILLVDPNWLPIEIEFIANWITLYAQGKKKYLAFTHSDYDHIIGYQRFSSFETIASRNFVENPAKEAILNQIRTFDDSNYILRAYDIVYPKIDVMISEPTTSLVLGADKYCFSQATGHNSDGIIIYNESTGLLIVGDYLSNVEFPYVYDSFSNYRTTLNTLENILTEGNVKILVSGHGDVTASQDEMHTRIRNARKYISDLQYAIEKDIAFDLAGLLAGYNFPQIMTTFHEANVKLLRQELGRGINPGEN